MDSWTEERRYCERSSGATDGGPARKADGNAAAAGADGVGAVAKEANGKGAIAKEADGKGAVAKEADGKGAVAKEADGREATRGWVAIVGAVMVLGTGATRGNCSHLVSKIWLSSSRMELAWSVKRACSVLSVSYLDLCSILIGWGLQRKEGMGLRWNTLPITILGLWASTRCFFFTDKVILLSSWTEEISPTWLMNGNH